MICFQVVQENYYNTYIKVNFCIKLFVFMINKHNLTTVASLFTQYKLTFIKYKFVSTLL